MPAPDSYAEIIPIHPPHPLAGVCIAQAEAALARALVSLRQAQTLAGRETEAVERIQIEIRIAQDQARGLLRRIDRASR